jgi:hypothetical protein
MLKKFSERICMKCMILLILSVQNKKIHKLLFARDWWDCGEWRIISNGHRVSFLGDKMFKIVAMVLQFCECTKLYTLNGPVINYKNYQ